MTKKKAFEILMSRISENDIAITLKSTVLHLWQDICLIRIS
jgi:hypothetical protein